MVSNQDPDLSAGARRIIDDARGVDDPTAEDRDRVKARWLASIAAVAGASSLAEAARAAGGIGWGVKAIGAALAIAAGAAGLYAFSSDDDARGREDGVASKVAAPAGEARNAAGSETAPNRELPAEVGGAAADERTADTTVVGGPSQVSEDAPAQPMAIVDAIIDSAPAQPVAQTAERASPVLSLEPQAAPALRAQRPSGSGARTVDRGAAAPALAAAQASNEQVSASAKSTPPVSAAPSRQLGEELSQLSKIRSSVQEGAPGRALELISDYRERFARPILGMEVDALRVDALCRTGQREAAQSSARAFQNDWPGSPLEQRVSSACP